MKKIFVTTGSSIGYEDLFEYISKFRNNFEIIIQKGNSKFVNPEINSFEFTTEIEKYYEWADIIIFTGGAATVFEVLRLHGKVLIGVANPSLLDNHQKELLQELSKNGYLFFAKKLSDIEGIITNYDSSMSKIENYTYSNTALLEYIYSYIHDVE